MVETGQLPQPKYFSDLKSHRPAIADFILRCERGQLEEVDRKTMLVRTHNIAIAAQNYNYKNLSDASVIAAEALMEKQSMDELLPIMRDLFSACNNALVILPVSLPINHATKKAPGQQILLTADDDRTVRAIVETMFEGVTRVITANNGREALEKIREYKPDLVLLDDMMPEMTGFTALENLRRDSLISHTKVIMLTSSDRPQDFARGYAANADDYITKPFNPIILAEKVHKFLSPN